MNLLAAQLSGPDIPWGDLVPLLLLLGGTCFLLLVGSLVPNWPKNGFSNFTIAISVSAIFFSVLQWNNLGVKESRIIINDSIVIDRFAVFASVVILMAVLLGSILMNVHLQREKSDGPELYALLLTAAIGGLVMVAGNELIVLFLGLETLSLSLYLMAASNRRREQSQEAGLKYFVLGGFSSAFFLYGVALIYGSTGSTNLTAIATKLSSSVAIANTDAMLLVGIGLLIIGIAFKVSAAPFHVWTPDVYEGSPSPVTAFMASAGKVAAFALLLRVVVTSLSYRADDWRPVIWVLAIVTVFVGSILAILQTDVKRMLAYSSISHAGFILVGAEAASHAGSNGLSSSMAYLFIYTVLVMGSFAVVIIMSAPDDSRTTLIDFKGLAKRRPALALGFSVLLLAQAGVPATAGFIAKFGVIKSAVDVESYSISIAAMIGAVIGAYLYLRIMISMWLEEPTSTDSVDVPLGAGIVVAVAVAFTLIIGLFPSLMLDLTSLITIFDATKIIPVAG